MHLPIIFMMAFEIVMWQYGPEAALLRSRIKLRSHHSLQKGKHFKMEQMDEAMPTYMPCMLIEELI